MNNLEITNSTIKMTNPYRRNNLIGWKLTLPVMTHSINGKVMTHSIFSNTIFLPEQRNYTKYVMAIAKIMSWGISDIYISFLRNGLL